LCKGGPLCDSEGIQSFLDIFGEIDSIQNFFDIMKNRFQREFLVSIFVTALSLHKKLH